MKDVVEVIIQTAAMIALVPFLLLMLLCVIAGLFTKITPYYHEIYVPRKKRKKGDDNHER